MKAIDFSLPSLQGCHRSENENWRQ